MEQTKCMNILLKNTNTMKKFNRRPCSSWEDYQEEEAFANDAIRGVGGGSVWPPRSYSCSFCKREFRSAQALGGHMNVHRRDRALLKQVITTHIDDHDHHQHDTYQYDHHQHDTHQHDHHQYDHHHKPSQVCNPKIKNSVEHVSLSRVSSNCVTSGVKKVISCTNDVDFQDKMSMGLDLAIGIYTQKKEDEEEEEFFKCNKRFKKSGDCDVANLFPIFNQEIKCFNNFKDGEFRAREIIKLKASKSMEELDLELRLGDPIYKVK